MHRRRGTDRFVGRLPVQARRLGRFYGVGAALFVGWVVYLGAALPNRNLVEHWNIAWVGLDVLILAALSSTAVLAWRRDPYVVMPAVATATLLVTDAWMDVTMSNGSDFRASVLLAVFVELPLAILSLVVAIGALGEFRANARPTGAVELRRALRASDAEERDARSA